MKRSTSRPRRRPIVVKDIEVHLLWFDSLGAKSSSLLVETPDISLLVDPGVAVMQPSYPLSDRRKESLERKGLEVIRKAAKRADTVFISHYHYDHHTLPSEASDLYEGKSLWVKNPNRWLNREQWERARLFLKELCGDESRWESLLEAPGSRRFRDPLFTLPIASAKDYGAYQRRKAQLLRKGWAWFGRLKKLWGEGPCVREFRTDGGEVQFADGRSIKVGSTSVRFTRPMFHGIEYDRVGWVVGLVVEHNGSKVLYTSDLEGPTIEDYAQWVIRENPDCLVMDGPATYLFGFIVNRINLQRAIDNACLILRKTRAKVIIYDHHLPRDRLYKHRLDEVYRTAEEEGKLLLTAAEWFGDEPLILKLTGSRLRDR